MSSDIASRRKVVSCGDQQLRSAAHKQIATEQRVHIADVRFAADKCCVQVGVCQYATIVMSRDEIVLV